MEDAEVVAVEVDAASVDTVLEDISEALNTLQILATKIGAELTKAFEMFQKSLQKVEKSIYAMIDALDAITDAVQKLISELSLEVIADKFIQALNEIANTGDTFTALFEGVIGGVVGVLTEKMLPKIMAAFRTLPPEIAAIVAAAVVAVAAITSAIIYAVKHWDEIVLFFTETIPQVWSQVTAWFTTLLDSIKAAFADTFYNLGVIASGCWEVIQTVWEPVASWFHAVVIKPMEQLLTALWNQMPADVQSALSNIMAGCIHFVTWVNEKVFRPLTSFITEQANGAINAAKWIWDGIKNIFSSVAGFFKDIFGKAWAAVMEVFSTKGDIFTNIKDAILTSFKRIVNAIITGINSVVRIPFNGINAALNSLRFTEVLGMYPFGSLGTIRVPQIPYLAQGAVLPANKPFLAMVGDQRHGTNIEAPLATIQEAVASVMGDQVSAMLAGFDALLEENRLLRQVVEGIELGDSVIGQSVSRYNRRLAVMRGESL